MITASLGGRSASSPAADDEPGYIYDGYQQDEQCGGDAGGFGVGRIGLMAAKAAMLSLGLLATGVLAAANARQADTTKPASVRFAAVHVCIDSKEQALAAYQCEISARNADVKIVGIEGNPSVAAFAEPPYYDPKALDE